MNLRILAGMALLAVLGNGCGSIHDRYIYSRTFDRPRDELVKTTLDVLDSEDQKLEKADMEKGVFECKWKETLHDFRYEGYRTKAFAKVETEKGSAGYKVGFMVRRQRNDAMENPADPANAEWSDTGFDETAENSMMYKLLGKLEPLEIEKDYERRQAERRQTEEEIDQMFEKAKVDASGRAQLDLGAKKPAPEGSGKK